MPERSINNSNRRVSSRVRATFQVNYKTLDSLVSAYTENISKGGLYIRTQSLLPINSMVRIKLTMPMDGAQIECIGQVARVHQSQKGDSMPTGMAVVFRDMSDDHRQFIENYIADMADKKIAAPVKTKARVLDILLVDDDKTVRARASKALREAGHHVETAPDGLKGLAICLANPPDLILTDVQMPKMDGWNFLRTIRARSSLAGTLVVFQTSLKDEKDRLLGYQLGVDDYLAKPYSAKELLARIRRLIERNDTQKSIHAGKGKSLRGDLEHVSLPTVLSLLEMEKKSGVMVVVGKALCRLYIRDGAPKAIDLEMDDAPTDPIGAAGELLEWTSGQFEFSPQDVPHADEFGVSMQGLLMEAARRSDETQKIKLR